MLRTERSKDSAFEWIEEGKGYREFLVPAAIVNTVKAWPAPDGGAPFGIARKVSKAAARGRTLKTRERKGGD
jgi:hypothetical protein